MPEIFTASEDQVSIAQLRQELHRLRTEMNTKITQLQAAQPLSSNPPSLTTDKPSRRKLLKKLALVAGGAVVATGAMATQTAEAGYRGTPASGSTSTISYGLAATPNGFEVWSPSDVNFQFGLIGTCDAPASTDPLATPTQFNTFTTKSGVLGYSVSSSTGVAGHSVTGAGIFGQSNSGLGADFSGGSAAIRLRGGFSAGAPTSGLHFAGELYVDTNGQLYLCSSAGTPGTWVKLSRAYTAGTNIILTNNTDGTTTIAANVPLSASSNIIYLTSPIRVVATTNSGGTTPLLNSNGSGNPNATLQSFQITGVNVGGQSVPAGAKGILGSLTSVGATAPGNLRLWTFGATPPTINTLNIPAKPDGTGFNLTTAFTVGLSSDGKVSIGYSNSVNGSSCGFSLDIVAYVV